MGKRKRAEQGRESETADENRGKRKNKEIRKRRRRVCSKRKVKGRVQDRFLLEWPGLGRVVEHFLKGRSLFTADMTRLPCREGNASPQPCYY